MTTPLAADGLPDDRITCETCRSYRAHYCAALKQCAFPALPLRCMAYTPIRSQADQRTGVQRWPRLQVDIEELRRMETK